MEHAASGVVADRGCEDSAEDRGGRPQPVASQDAGESAYGDK
jgi:hypothetical protein